ncbi:MAG: lamin tail domain-containing protein [Candidatus Woesearchaeota archaeon]
MTKKQNNYSKIQVNYKIKNMFLFVFSLLFCLVLFLKLVFADTNNIIITEVLYNPTGSENCREAVEIYNPTNKDINIGGWYLRTKSSLKDAIIPQGTIIKSKSYFLIADSNWSNCKEDYWPNADYEESITLANTDGGVALVDNLDNKIDSVCWGSVQEYFCEGEPAVIVVEGNSISRRFFDEEFIDTENNSFDFYETRVNLKNSNSSKELSLEISFSVVEEDISIFNVSITDDLEREGFQVLPKPNSDKIIVISAKTSINNSVLKCSVEGLGQKEMIFNNGSYFVNFSIPHYFEPKDYEVIIYAYYNNRTTSYSTSFSFEELLAIMIDSKNIEFGNIIRGEEKIILGDNDTSTIQKPTIKNIGNVNANIIITNTEFYKNNTNSISFPSGMIMYSFSNDFSKFYGYLNETKIVNLNIKPAEKMPINFKIFVPEEQELGVYYGSLMIGMIKS